MLILLNGTSSAGKTTLAKALQDTLPTPYLVVGIDTVVFGLPSRYVNDPEYWSEVYQYHYDGAQLVGITMQPYGDQLVRGLHRAVAGLAQGGLDVIVDHVLSEPAWIADLDQTWAGLDQLRVGVLCPIEVAEERERTRRNRTLGWAKAHADIVHAHVSYDVTVDTSLASPAECAATVAAAVANRRSPTDLSAPA
ncbi:MAG TPA: AAA family ATPase [Streptosporangiaceae bacterium]|nr:AAA family ATPase [Streptosporangiaceae bacterium]